MLWELDGLQFPVLCELGEHGGNCGSGGLGAAAVFVLTKDTKEENDRAIFDCFNS